MGTNDSIPGFRLTLEGGKAYLVNTSNNLMVELTDDEATVLFNNRNNCFSDFAERNILPLYYKEHEVSNDFDQLDIRQRIPKDELNVMLDATTLGSALDCLDCELTPLNLLNLSTVAFATVFYDKVFVQPYGWYWYYNQYTDFFDEVIRVVKYPTDSFIRDDLWTICVENFENAKAERSTFTGLWAEFLHINAADIKLDLHKWDKYQDSPIEGGWTGVLASYFGNGTYHQHVDTKPSEAFNEYLSIITMRCLFNDRLASLLGIPYVCCSFRVPIHSYLISKKIQLRSMADRILSAVSPPTSSEEESGPFVCEFSVPFLTGLIFERIKNRGQFIPALLELRGQFAPLRSKLRKDRDVYASNPNGYLRSFLDTLASHKPDNLAVADEAISATASTGIALSTATNPALALSSLGVKLLKLLQPTKRIRELYHRLFRPEIYLLTSLADEASRLKLAEHYIAKLWGDLTNTWSKADHEQLEMLSKANPNKFLKLPKL